MYKRIALSLMLSGMGCLTLQAQYLQDILRFSQPEFGASARFKALGNAQTALGGDLSNISGNPAGLGFFNQSDIGLSLDYINDLNKATYFGTNSQQAVDKIGFSQAGAVFHIPARRARGSNLSSGWLNFNIGIAYNKTNNFNSTVRFTGINDESSIADFMTYEGGNVHGNFGWDAGLIDEFIRFDNSGNMFKVDAPMTTLDNVQTVTSREKGFQSETNISFGANYSNRFYIGGSIGFTHVNNNLNYLYVENGKFENASYIAAENPESRFVDPTHEDYDFANRLLDADYDYQEENWSTTTGSGFNAKLGLIYKPIEQVQIGFSATSPTWYRLTNDYADYFGVDYYMVNGTDDYFEYPEEESYFDYNLRTPYRLNAGIASVLGQGLISADVEYVDYASMTFSSTDPTIDNRMNDQVRSNFTGAVNFRLGGEYMIAPAFLLRAGYGYGGSPYQDLELTSQTVSGGLGYRVNNVYVDLTYRNFSQKYGWRTYELDDVNEHISPVADITNSRNSVFLTVGLKF